MAELGDWLAPALIAGGAVVLWIYEWYLRRNGR